MEKVISDKVAKALLVQQEDIQSVCVCTAHQNINLMLSAIRLDRVYHELIEKKVYRRENKVCMIHRCEECPGIHQLETYLETKLMSITDDEFAGFDDIEATEDKKEEIVTFK